MPEPKPNRKKNRLKGYDYSNPGIYFLTICTEKRVNYFGKIVDGEMVPNTSGKIVIEKWNWLSEQYPYIELDEYVLMPNHFHGIIAIIEEKRNGRDRSLQKIKSISSLIGAFKTTSSKAINLNSNINFKRQKSFYDRIIRNEKELENVQAYIYYNPIKWQFDIENSEKYDENTRSKYYNNILSKVA